jgi:hypothetical protein
MLGIVRWRNGVEVNIWENTFCGKIGFMPVGLMSMGQMLEASIYVKT